jgi:putative membrane protein
MKTFLQTTVAGIFVLIANIPFAQAASLSDAQIAAIVVAANTVDIEAGKLADDRSEKDEIKAFAKQMVSDHSAVNEQATALVKKLNLTPVENDTSKGLKENGSKTRATLKELKGAAFDKAYVDNEIAYHQTVLDALDKTLIPSAQNSELKALLVKVRPAFVAHLEHAKQIKSSLK